MTVPRSLAAAFAAAAFAAACGGGGEQAASSKRAPEPSAAAVANRSPLADRVVELDDAIHDAREHRPSRHTPVSLRIEALDIAGASIVAVGVEPNGELEVPGPEEVGWYRFGTAPGEPGSAVLAAHVAFDGADGVFRHLDDLAPGDEVIVGMDDGTAVVYRVDGVTVHPKDSLPDELWSREGPPRLALITCGGSFDSARRSYDSNVVVWATPAPTP